MNRWKYIPTRAAATIRRLTKVSVLDLTKAQRKSLVRVVRYQGWQNVKAIQYGWDCIMVNVNNMWIGIEKYGYAHS